MALLPHKETGNSDLFHLIKNGAVRFAGNNKLRIYGLLRCATGKRMKKENRVFFSSEAEAINHGYRPCGQCMRTKYKQWKYDNFR